MFVTLDDARGPVDATFFEDAQGPYAATLFHSWLLVVRGDVRRTGPRGVSLRATGCWELPELHAAWLAGGLDAVAAADGRHRPGHRAGSVAGAAESRSTRPVMTRPPARRRPPAVYEPREAGRPGSGRRHGRRPRRVLVHASGFRQSPYADIKPPGESGDDARAAARKERGEGAAQAVALQPGQLGRVTSLAAVPHLPLPTRLAPRRTRPHRRGVGRAARGGSAGSAQPLDVLDVGGGTGGFAVPLADARPPGHRGRPQPRRAGRAASAGPARPASQVARRPGRRRRPARRRRARQRRPGALPRRARARRRPRPPRCAALAAVLRPGGTLSLLVANRNAVVLARALAGRFAEARHALDDPDGRWGAGDPLPAGSPSRRWSRCSATAGLRSRRCTACAPSPTWCPARWSTPSRARPTRCSRWSAATAERARVPRRSRPSCTCWPTPGLTAPA